MAVKIPYLVERDGMLYFVRRVPKAIADQPAALQRHFRGQAVVRISLGTKDRLAAVKQLEELNKTLDAVVSQALDTRAVNKPALRRPVTADALRILRQQNSDAIEREFRQLRLMREAGGERAEWAEETIDRSSRTQSTSLQSLLEANTQRTPASILIDAHWRQSSKRAGTHP